MGLDTLSGLVNSTAFSFCALLVCLTCVVYMALQDRYDKVQSGIFGLVIFIVGVSAASNMIAEVVIATGPENDALHIIRVVCNYIYFVVHTALAPLFCLYVLILCGANSSKKSLRNNLYASAFYFSELLALTNPFTQWVYSYGPNNEFVRHWGVYVIYAVGFLYVVLGIINLLMKWNAMTPRKRGAIEYFFVMCIAGVLIQLIWPEVRIELFAEALAVLGVMLFVESEEDLVDFETGVYNRRALKMELDKRATGNSPYYVIAVRIIRSDIFGRVGDSNRSTALVVAVAKYLREVAPWYFVYRSATSRFFIINPEFELEEASRVAAEIAARFDSSWDAGGIDVNVRAMVVIACVPTDLPTPEDVMYLADAPMPIGLRKRVLKGDDLNYLVRRAEVERAVKRGLEEGTYEVYYQPVYRADGTLCSAEALMRLHDSVLGEVPPLEFIEVAESGGQIEDIGQFALEQVCAFIESGVPDQLGIECVNVNLSVVQCMQVDFVDRVKKTVDKHGVDPHKIAFEITESVASGNYEFLANVMGELKACGHRFAMDDYGTGYSNPRSLLALDFDVVKIDKSVLWGAEKSETGMIVLENSVAMLLSIAREVLVEGVETADQVALMRRLGTDYFQGYYFARPMPKDELVAFLADGQPVNP